VFSGLTTRDRVEALFFVEVKSGNARLTGSQQSIKKAVEDGSVQFRITPQREKYRSVDTEGREGL